MSEWPSRDCTPLYEDRSTRQQGPLSLVSANREVQRLIEVFPITWVSVSVLGHSMGGLKKRAEKSNEFTSANQRELGPVFQHKADRSAVQHSWPKLLLGKYLLRTLSFPWGNSIYILERITYQWCVNRILRLVLKHLIIL